MQISIKVVNFFNIAGGQFFREHLVNFFNSVHNGLEYLRSSNYMFQKFPIEHC